MRRVGVGFLIAAALLPFIGTASTVIGMMGAFRQMAESETPTSPDDMAGHMGSALTLTAVGVSLAIMSAASGVLLIVIARRRDAQHRDQADLIVPLRDN